MLLLEAFIQGTTLDNIADKISKGRQRAHQGPAPWNAGSKPALQGENSVHAKLTEDDVREIRRRRESGEILKAIAADFGITFGLVGHIAKRRIWKHVI